MRIGLFSQFRFFGSHLHYVYVELQNLSANFFFPFFFVPYSSKGFDARENQRLREVDADRFVAFF